MLRKRLPDSRIQPGGIRAGEVTGTLEASEDFHIVRCEKEGARDEEETLRLTVGLALLPLPCCVESFYSSLNLETFCSDAFVHRPLNLS